MRQIRMLPAVLLLFALSVLPCVAQKGSPMAASEDIVGTVQSFSGNTLAIKPPATPSVWVTIPDGMKVDRDELKPGTEVSIEARWGGRLLRGHQTARSLSEKIFRRLAPPIVSRILRRLYDSS